jgi:hypothetical protein
MTLRWSERIRCAAVVSRVIADGVVRSVHVASAVASVDRLLT